VQWLLDHKQHADVDISDISDMTAKIDVQGPTSAALLARVLPDGLPALKYYHFTKTRYNDIPLIVSRTGYTGELGYEFYGPPETLTQLWEACHQAGATPAGLGARDTLRLEAGYPLYGHELGTDRPAHESGFTKSIDLSKEFLGSEALNGLPPRNRLVGLALEGRQSARADDSVTLAGNDEVVGVVTSGSFGPSVGYAVALAYCNETVCDKGRTLEIAGRRTKLACQVAQLPFYKDGTVRVVLDATN
jgi:aminomethyltransferase